MKLIPLTQGKFAMVDDADYEAVMQFKWYAYKSSVGTFYAGRKVKNQDGTSATQRLHQFLMPGIPMVDHEDGDGLNNQRYNLRPCTRSQNNRNARKRAGGSGFKGVSWNNWNEKWMAYINFDCKRHNLGYFFFKEDAARAYDTAAKKFHKEFARLNFPE